MIQITYENFYLFMGLVLWMCDWRINSKGTVYLSLQHLLIAVTLWPLVLMLMIFDVKGIEFVWKHKGP